MKSGGLKISASLWSANLAELGSSLGQVERYCDSFHFDIMDGHYTPTLLFGPDIVKALRGLTNKPFEVHFMVTQPESLFEQFIEAGADVFILHSETCDSIIDTVNRLKSINKKVGIAIRSEENCDEVIKLLNMIDYVILMGTEIGIKGVSIQPNVYEKIKILRQEIVSNNYNVEIQIDGGIRVDTVPKIYEHGADIITAGSLLFNNDHEEIFKWVKGLTK
ncbi:MAG: Ribulose-phosphate 3-epimerase [Firmicutes bacterium ADurb.Bin419]|nr:MAG: Ribulose-phosphate 3-epimerase [Firmicutes bacterium ADurb.Bin419]